MSISDLLALFLHLQGDVSKVTVGIAILNFFNSFFTIAVIFIHTAGVYLRSRDVVSGRAIICVKYLLATYLALSIGSLLSSIILMASLGVENLEWIPGRYKVKNLPEDYLGMASGGLLVIIDFTFLLEFYEYLRVANNLFGCIQSTFSRIVITEAAKMIVLSIIALISYAIYATLRTGAGPWFYVPFRLSILMILLLWMRLHIRLRSNKIASNQPDISQPAIKPSEVSDDYSKDTEKPSNAVIIISEFKNVSN